MSTKQRRDPEIHALTTAEINRQIAAHNERRRQIVAERAAIYAHAIKHGTTVGRELVDSDERAAREHAKSLLNGSAPADLMTAPAEISQDRLLAREQRGLDIVLRVLSDKSLVARAADAVDWAEQHGDRWARLCRDIVLSSVRLDALNKAAEELIGRCPDLDAAQLPLSNLVGGRPVALEDLVRAALEKGAITPSELKEAKNV